MATVAEMLERAALLRAVIKENPEYAATAQREIDEIERSLQKTRAAASSAALPETRGRRA